MVLKKKPKMRNKIILVIVSVIGLVTLMEGQDNYSNNPFDAQFVTEDVDRFWSAFEKIDELGVKAFEGYIDKGTNGVKDFIPYRIINADSLYHMVQRRKSDYLRSKDVLDDLESKRKRIRSIYTSMKYWYPDAVFPPVYFVIGRFNTGGTVSEAGIIIGTEMQKDLKGLPGLIAHELIHYQQKNEGDLDLLLQSLNEGSADFIGELISGEHINSTAFNYGEEHLDTLCKEFVLLMHQENYTDWLYGTSGKDDRPNDLGYWIGYKITEAYFNKQENKHEAIKSILTISEAQKFVQESGFLDKYIKAVGLMTEKDKERFLRIYSEEVYEVTLRVTVPSEKDRVYITGNQDELANWEPKRIEMKKLSDKIREITLKVHTPAQFKFTRGSWETEAVIEGIEGFPNLKIEVDKADEFEYGIKTWKDKMKTP